MQCKMLKNGCKPIMQFMVSKKEELISSDKEILNKYKEHFD